MRVGDIVCAKSIEHRQVVEIREDKNGRQRPVVNRFGFKFQPEQNLISRVGIFLFLGTEPETEDSDRIQRVIERRLRDLGWMRADGDTGIKALETLHGEIYVRRADLAPLLDEIRNVLEGIEWNGPQDAFYQKAVITTSQYDEQYRRMASEILASREALRKAAALLASASTTEEGK